MKKTGFLYRRALKRSVWPFHFLSKVQVPAEAGVSPKTEFSTQSGFYRSPFVRDFSFLGSSVFWKKTKEENLKFSSYQQLIKNKKGQVTVEYLLLAVALIALFQIAVTTLKDNQTLENFQKTPGQIFRNLVENGNWDPKTDTSRAFHPNHYEKLYTPNGEGAK